MVEELSSKANPAENESCLERQERMVLLLVLYIFQTIFFFLLQSNPWDFPDGPVVKILCSQHRGHRFDAWSKN